MLQREHAIKWWFVNPPLLTSVSALPGETWTLEIVFSVMLADNAAGVHERCRASSHCSVRRHDHFASRLAMLQWPPFCPRTRRSRQHVPKAVSLSGYGIKHDWHNFGFMFPQVVLWPVLVGRGGITINKSPFDSTLSQQHLCKKIETQCIIHLGGVCLWFCY